MKTCCNFVQSHLSSGFKALGSSVGKRPLPYLTVPVILTIILSAGFYWIEVCKDIEFLYSPTNGRSLREREAVESLFPPSNYSMDLLSATRLRGVAAILLVPKDNSSVFKEEILQDAVKIDRIIYNISITWKNRSLTLKDICLKMDYGECASNDILHLRGRIQDIKGNKLRIKFPYNFDTITQQMSVYAFGLGGVTMDGDNFIEDALALRLCYLLNYTTPDTSEISKKWEESFLDVISRTRLQTVTIFRAASVSIDNEVNRLTESALPLIKGIIPLMLSFAVLSTMTRSCITSKPWAAVAGCMSPVLAVFSTFGLLLMIGVPYIDTNIALFFLMVGIGLDDSFIMLAAWRRTDSKMTVEERLSQSYSDAAVSISITSLTNCLTLCVGLGSPFQIVRLYCVYAALSIVFAYVYQITFFGGALALSGIREQKALHPILCIPVKEETVFASSFSKLIYVGCVRKSRLRDNNKGKQQIRSSFLQYLLSIMLRKEGKFSVIICFLLYISTSSYCLTLMKDEFSFKDVMLYDSYTIDYLNIHYKYFTNCAQPVHIVINETLDYSSKEVQRDIEDTLSKFSEDPNMGGSMYTYSWLKYFLQSVQDRRLWLAYYGYNVSDSKDFMEALTNVFLNLHPTKKFRQHIKFNQDETKILSSRFIIVSKDVSSSAVEKRLLSNLWSIADSVNHTLYVHNFWFPLYNLMIEISPYFTNTLFTATGLVTLVFFLVIPNILCTISILFTTLSIQSGVIGYMSLWNVSINPLSVMCVIISIGLSVDYAAHISYAYLSCKEGSPNEKTKVALSAAGFPIIQGCISTLLGVLVLVFSKFNTFLVFFKVITLVMLISLFHGLLVIPITLNIFDTMWTKILQKFNEVSNRSKDKS